MAPEEIITGTGTVVSWVSEKWIFCRQPYTFHLCGVDPYPHSEYGPQRSWIRIQFGSGTKTLLRY